ncbi:MAG: TldD/PmbA family protein [Phycisphaerae bacterium]|nr:TldD/PmbA family protein [Phycisphaerae bacterium]
MNALLMTACAAWFLTVPAPPSKEAAASESPLLKLLAEELAYAAEHLKSEDGTKPYYLAYTVTDRQTISVSARLGTLYGAEANHRRMLDVDVRVGDYALDNTHKIRDEFGGFDPSDFLAAGGTSISLDDEPAAIRQAIWLATDRAFKAAVKKYQRVQTNLKTKVEEEDKSADFSRETPRVNAEPAVRLSLSMGEWADRLREISKLARRHPLIYASAVALSASAENRLMVTSEGTRLQFGRKLFRVSVSAGTKAEDGMELGQSFIFDSASEAGLPSAAQVSDAFGKVIEQTLALRAAPLVEPYTGPAILRNRASGVFFHEIFGHRIEGHRQRDVEEGQTFAKKIGEAVLPEFLDVHDNPTMARFGDADLRGFYRFDDEGVPAQDVRLIERGVLKTFLLSRTPVEKFPNSNGHGRREPGRPVVARQGNLMVKSSKTVPFATLRAMLIEECKKQDKAYGLLFEDITGGFTTTRRMGPQAFKVLPVVVYKVFADGRPDQLVRGVDIVGTPLACFSKIVMAGDDPAVFNGTCGAESGMVPVSAISPSILVSQIEIEKRRREQDKPPILPPPIGEAGETSPRADAGRGTGSKENQP